MSCRREAHQVARSRLVPPMLRKWPRGGRRVSRSLSWPKLARLLGETAKLLKKRFRIMHDTGELRNCSNVAQTLTNSRPKVVLWQAKSGPSLANSGRLGPQVGLFGPKSEQFRPKVAEPAQMLAAVGQICPDVGQSRPCLAASGQMLAKSGETWPNSGRSSALEATGPRPLGNL